jgi:hypothetical protein
MKVYPMQALPFTMQLSALCTQASPRTRHNKATERAIFPKTHTAVVPRKQGTVPRRQHESRTIHPAYMHNASSAPKLCAWAPQHLGPPTTSGYGTSVPVGLYGVWPEHWEDQCEYDGQNMEEARP